MANNVSLLPSQAKFQLDRMRMAKTGRKIAQMIFVFSFLFFGAVWGMWFYYDRAYKNSQDDLKEAERSFAKLGKQVELNQELRYRLKLVSGVLADRFNYGSATKAVYDFIPEGATIDRLSFESKGVVSIKGELTGSEKMEEFEKKIRLANETSEENEVKGVKILDLTANGQHWNFSLEVLL